MFLRAVSTGALIATLLAGGAAADDAAAARLFETLGLPDIIEVMREEGIAYGDQIGTDLFPSKVSPSWAAAVQRIYDAEEMNGAVKADFIAALDGDDVDAMSVFFLSDVGRNFVRLEISARRALLDDAVEKASKELAAIAQADETPRFKSIDQFVQINDLIETNVVGALNSSFAFYTGLMEGGAFETAMSEDKILSDVWDQEPEIRTNTSEWIYSFLLLAYDPVSDADMEAYITFSQSDAGMQLNSALFVAFEVHFDKISRDLGYEAARMMSGAEL